MTIYDVVTCNLFVCDRISGPVTAVDVIRVGELALPDLTIEAGAMNNYGFDIAGILGFDFLQQTGAVIDLSAMGMRASRQGHTC